MRSKHKFGAVKTVVDGITFASKAEASRYSELKLLERAGVITDLKLQPSWELARPVKFKDATRTKSALKYVADFAYRHTKTSELVIEDVKGVQTTDFIIKRHLMLAMLGLHVTLITKRKRA